jgi:ribose 1,5-bisphosphokinase PhnN
MTSVLERKIINLATGQRIWLTNHVLQRWLERRGADGLEHVAEQLRTAVPYGPTFGNQINFLCNDGMYFVTKIKASRRLAVTVITEDQMRSSNDFLVRELWH